MPKALLFLSLFLFLLIALLAFWGAFKTKETLALCQPLGQFKEISVDDLKVNFHYSDHGSGPAIVLLHGASSNLNDWHLSLQPLLKGDYRVIALDRPGLGLSSRPKVSGSTLDFQKRAIHQFLQELKVENPIIVGHSLSGVISARLMADHPEFYRGLILIAGAVYPVGDGKSWYTKAAQLPLLGTLFRYSLIAPLATQIAPGLIEKNFSPNPVPDEYMRASCLNLLFEPRRFLNNAVDLHHIRPYLDESYPLYVNIKKPALLLYGKDDQTIYPDVHSKGFVEKVPHARLHFMEETGHLPHHFHSNLLLKEIKSLFF